ncbi:MAG TPA: hypothetical protein VHN79_01505 [Lacunisphaera sp.]|nr:hypothetical protein [Lacunisphaera sp.]
MNTQKPASSAKPAVRDIPVPASVVPRNPPGDSSESDKNKTADTRRAAKPAASPLAPGAGQLSPPVDGS